MRTALYRCGATFAGADGQVPHPSTLDDELAQALARIDAAPRSKAALVRDPGGRHVGVVRQHDARFAVRWTATRRAFGVLHLDAHYDTLAAVLGFASVRLDADD